jgi:DNA-binding CsgD family transcriptional regulator
MFPENPAQKLELLTERQRDVLRLFCDHLAYKEIGEKLFISKNTVKAHMGNIYLRLGLDEMPDSQRKQTIYQVYCLALSGFVPLQIIPEEPEEPDPVPEYVMAMVEKDEMTIIKMPPREIIDITPKPEPPPRRLTCYTILSVILGMLLTILVAAAGWRVYQWLYPPQEATLETQIAATPVGLEQTVETMLTATIAQMLPVPSPTTDFRDDTVILTDTPVPSTPTPEQPTPESPTPTETQQTSGLGIDDELSDGRVKLTLLRDIYNPTTVWGGWLIEYNFRFTNLSSENVFLQTFSKYYTANDNVGHEWDCDIITHNVMSQEEISLTIAPSDSYQMIIRCGKDLKMSEEMREITVYIAKLSTLPPSSWAVTVPR